MTKTIHKYVLDITDNQTIKTKMFAKPLDIQIQNDKVCLWMEVDPTYTDTNFYIKCFGTGHPIDLKEPWKYFKTIQAGPLVFHYYLPY